MYIPSETTSTTQHQLTITSNPIYESERVVQTEFHQDCSSFSVEPTMKTSGNPFSSFVLSSAPSPAFTTFVPSSRCCRFHHDATVTTTLSAAGQAEVNASRGRHYVRLLISLWVNTRKAASILLLAAITFFGFTNINDTTWRATLTSPPSFVNEPPLSYLTTPSFFSTTISHRTVLSRFTDQSHSFATKKDEYIHHHHRRHGVDFGESYAHFLPRSPSSPTTIFSSFVNFLDVFGFNKIIRFASAASVPPATLGVRKLNLTSRFRPNGTVLSAPAGGPYFASKLTLCYLIFGPIDDLGFSYAMNLGRLAAERTLRAKYPEVTFQFRVADKFSMSNRTAVLWAHAASCDHIVMGVDPLDEALLRVVARAYPSKLFFAYNSFWYADQPANVISYVHVLSESFYIAGATAAVQSRNCVGAVAAFEDMYDPSSSMNGLLRGVRSVNSTMPVHMITIDSWYAPERETQAAQALYAATKCDVILHYTDPTSTNVVAREAGIFSNGMHADQGPFLGDSTLVSLAWRWEVAYINFVEQFLHNGAIDNNNPLIFGLDSGLAYVTDLSPEASDAARAERLAATDRLDQNGGTDLLYCNRTIETWDGVVKFTPTPEQPCIDWMSFLTFNYFEKGIVRHPYFAGYDACAAGTYVHVALHPTVRLQCVPCPANTYSIVSGQTSCERCKDGFGSAAGATICSEIPTVNIVAIVVPIVAVVVLAAAIGAYVYGRVRLANRLAPKDGERLCLIFTDIESSTALWEKHPADMLDAVALHHAAIRSLIAEFEGYEIKVVGDAFMVAFRSAMNGVLFTAAVQRSLMAQPWSDAIAALPPSTNLRPPESDDDIADEPVFCGLRVRIGAHWCVDASARYDRTHQRYDYYGPDVNVTARIEHIAVGGQTLVSALLWEEAAKDPSFELASAMLHPTDWAHDDLKGVGHEIPIYDVMCEDLPRYFKNKHSGNGNGGEHISIGGAVGEKDGQLLDGGADGKSAGSRRSHTSRSGNLSSHAATHDSDKGNGGARPEIIAYKVLTAALLKAPASERATLVNRLCQLNLPEATVKNLPPTPIAQLALLAGALKKSVGNLGKLVGGAKNGQPRRRSNTSQNHSEFSHIERPLSAAGSSSSVAGHGHHRSHSQQQAHNTSSATHVTASNSVSALSKRHTATNHFVSTSSTTTAAVGSVTAFGASSNMQLNNNNSSSANTAFGAAHHHNQQHQYPPPPHFIVEPLSSPNNLGSLSHHNGGGGGLNFHTVTPLNASEGAAPQPFSIVTRVESSASCNNGSEAGGGGRDGRSSSGGLRLMSASSQKYVEDGGDQYVVIGKY